MTRKTQEQVEREVRHKFWLERYRQTKDLTYRNKLWKDCCMIGHKMIVMYTPRGSWYDTRYDEYVCAMMEGFEKALNSFDFSKGTSWNTHMGWWMRSKLAHCKDAFNTKYALEQYHINSILLDDVFKDLEGIRVFVDPRNYAEEAIWNSERKSFLKTLSENDQKIVRLILEGESLTSIAEQVVHNRNTNDMRKRCLKIGRLYKEYMGG